MRTIKFRAFEKELGKMFPWEEIKDHSLHSLIAASEEFPLMQYTGLKDKNGKEIYEGDKVLATNLFEDKMTGEIIWHPGRGAFMVKSGDCQEYFEDISEIEVIGNIYEGERI